MATTKSLNSSWVHPYWGGGGGSQTYVYQWMNVNLSADTDPNYNSKVKIDWNLILTNSDPDNHPNWVFGAYYTNVSIAGNKVVNNNSIESYGPKQIVRSGSISVTRTSSQKYSVSFDTYFGDSSQSSCHSTYSSNDVELITNYTVSTSVDGEGTAGVSEYPWDSSAADFKPSVSVIPSSTVYFQATPTIGHHLVNWTENSTVISTAPTFSATVTEDRTLTANFAINSHNVILSYNDSIQSVSGAGPYNYGNTVTVTATLKPNTVSTIYSFENWKRSADEVVVSTLPVYSFTMPDHNVSLKATGSSTIATYTVTVIADKGLKVTGNIGATSVTIPRTIVIKPAEHSATYSVNYNTAVNLEATVDTLSNGESTGRSIGDAVDVGLTFSDYEFDHWEIDGVPVESSESSESNNLVTNVTGNNVLKAVSVINKWLVQLDGDLPDGVKCYTNSAMTQEWSGISWYDKSDDKNVFKLYTKIEGTHNRQFSRPTVLEEVAYLDEYDWKGWIINGVQTPLDLDDTLTFSVDKDYTIKPWIEPVDFKLISVTTKYGENIDNTKGTVEISYTSLKSDFTYKNNKNLYIPDVDETVSKTNKIKFTAKPAVNYCLEKFTYYGVIEDIDTDIEESTGNRGIDNIGASTIVIYDNPMYLSVSNAEQVTAYFELWNYEGATWKHCYVFVKTGDNNKPDKGWKVVKDYKYWNGTEWKDHVD